MAAPGTPPSLDLAFRLEDQHGQGLAPGLQPLLAAAGPLADRLADDHWQQLLGHWLAQLAGELPAELRSPAYSLGLQLTDDASIALLNGAWRQQNEPTDVLSFAAQEAALDDLPAIPLPALPGGESLELGDIVISLETAARQAEAQGHDLPTELLFLASHGLLHLLGWDHPDAASLAAMLARQEALIAND